jgi:hypothetical protein
MKKNHPYKEYQGLDVWKVLDKGIKDLQANGDVVETTARPYIVGYLSKLLVDAGLIALPSETVKPRRAAKSSSQRS